LHSSLKGSRIERSQKLRRIGSNFSEWPTRAVAGCERRRVPPSALTPPTISAFSRGYYLHISFPLNDSPAFPEHYNKNNILMSYTDALISFKEALLALRITRFTGIDKSAILLGRSVLLNMER